jgi:hypothetical protein
MRMFDAQAALGFLTNQAYVINARVYRTPFPDLNWNELVFVDQSAPEWSLGMTTFISNMVGRLRHGSTPTATPRKHRRRSCAISTAC